ncbi:MAG TPA: DUF3301 domain-containing protein [Rhodanobacteraceae bacterium]
MPTEWLLLLAFAAVIGAWLDTMRQHDCALTAAQRICARHDVQLLDHTVSLVAIKLRRHDGRLTLERHYVFEVSLDGHDRHAGRLWLRQGRLGGVSAPWLKAPDVRTVDARAAVTELLERVSHDRTE